MIIKSFDIDKIKSNKNGLILFYGKNEGFKKEVLNEITKKKQKIFTYDEKEILDKEDFFYENLFSGSLFNEEKTIIIKRATDRLMKIIDNVISKELNDIKIIINSDNLEKKSKLRIFFEKSKKHICVPFYLDNEQTLSRIVINFLKDKQILISQENINLIVNKCNGDRQTLFNELQKIEAFAKSGKKLTLENLTKIINLTENHSITELVDNCLAKNQRRTVNILNENNFVNEDCIIIIRIFLNKAKKILTLAAELNKGKDINSVISSARPPIFWKDKDITKKQILKWSPEKMRLLIYKLNDLELLIKTNINNSVNLLTDFILDQSSETNN